MGSYTEFSVDGYPLVETKSYAIPEVLTVFRESDKRVFQRMFSERNSLVWGEAMPEDDGLETVVLYQSSAKNIAQRLDIMGFTLHRAQQDFERLRQDRFDELKPDDDGAEDPSWESRDEIERLTFTNFSENLLSVMRRKLRKAPFEDKDSPSVSSAERYILEYNEDYLLGYFCSDTRFLIRLASNECSLSETV